MGKARTARVMGGYARLCWVLACPVLYCILTAFNVNNVQVRSGYVPTRSMLTAGGEEGRPTQRSTAESLSSSSAHPLCQGIGGSQGDGQQISFGDGQQLTLFDVASLPSREEACAHCSDPENLHFCCGVCVFEDRWCDKLHPGQQVSERVLRQSAEAGLHLEELTPCELLQRIRGRTLWFMGDSQTWHFYLAVECFLHQFAVDLRRRHVSEDPELQEALRQQPSRSLRRYTMCLQLVEDTRVCVIRVDYPQDMVEHVFPNLRRLGRDLTRDLMVWNFGLHGLRNSEETVPKLELAAGYLAANRTWLPRMVWMDTAPQHFETEFGSYRPGVPLQPCVPLQDSPMVQQGGEFNSVARAYLDRLGDAHLATWNATAPLYYAHMAKECSHFCQPGPYQLWTYLLNKALSTLGK